MKITFTPDTKEVSPALRVSSEWTKGCIKPHISLGMAKERFGLDAIYFYGIEVRCEFVNGILGKSVTSFDPDKDSSLTGDEYFFEYWRFEGPMVGCYGDTRRWQITLCFSRGRDFLFGFSELISIFNFSRFQGFTVNFDVKTGIADPIDLTETWLMHFGWQGTS
jgi:hypothetical protein